MRNTKELKDLNNKKIIFRADFDVPVSEGKIEEIFRIRKQKEMLDELLGKGALITIVAHIAAIESFEPILPQLEEILGRRINLLSQLEELDGSGQLNLLDNIRHWPEEKDNDPDFAQKLAKFFDIYVNNAFAVCHRKHASVDAITKFLPSYAGSLVEDEASHLQDTMERPKEGKIFIMAGAKAETKVPVIKNVIDKAEKILLGGVVANDILKARGEDMDNSVVDENPEKLLAGVEINDNRLILPEDFSPPNGKISDIGPETIKKFGKIIREARMVVWNGPLGIFEDERYAIGTNAVSRAIVDSSAVKIIGGGDTVSAVDKINLLDKFDFVSTGGGSMLSFLAGDKLPGLEALGYYK